MSDQLTETIVIAPAEDQQAFINKWSWGGLLGFGAYFWLSLPPGNKTGGDYFRSIMARIISPKGIFHGRRIIWETGKWGTDFESYKKRQLFLDILGIAWGIIILLLCILYFSGVIKGPTKARFSPPPSVFSSQYL